MKQSDRVRLLYGPYTPPALQRGDRAFCLFRDCTVVVTGWTDARISWPRCRALDGTGGGSGVLVNEELARPVRSESAAAITHWWRVAECAVWRWRKALGVTRTNNEGSRRLIHAAAEAGGQALRVRGITEEECDAWSRNAVRLDLKRFLLPGSLGPRWTPAELQLLGKEPDDVVAGKVSRSAHAVRLMRTRLGIPTARDRRRKT